MLQERSAQRNFALAAAGLSLLAAAVLLVGIPALIDSAYYGRSLPALDALITGQRVHPVGFYLHSWRRVALLALGAVILFWPLLFALLRWAIPYAGPRLRAMGPNVGVVDAVVAATAIGLAAGALEGAAVGLRHAILHPNLDFFFPERLWMSPVSSAIAFAVLGLLFWVVARPLRLALLPIIVAAGSAVAVLGITRNLHLGLHPVAAAVLMAGIGIRLGVWAGARGAPATRRVLRMGGGVLAALVVAFALGLAGVKRGYERWAYASLAGAPAGASNVLLIILDTVRAQSLSLYGLPFATTPALERFGQGGVVFDRAVTASPWTLPSHASIVTGRVPSEHGASRSTPMNDRYPTVGEVLRAHGYETAGFVANTYWLQPGSGVPRGLVHYEVNPLTFADLEARSWIGDQLLSLATGIHESRFLDSRKYADEVNRELLGWLDRRPAGRPFFAMLNYYDAHEPYTAPVAFRSRVGPGPLRQHFAPYGHKYSAQESEALVRGYESSIAYLDDRLGRLFGELRQRHLLDNTLVIVTADHGEEFAERNPKDVGHGENLDYPVLRVPLLMVLPGKVPAGRRVDAPVSLLALPSTILDVLGLPNRVFPAPSLAGSWQHDTTAAPVLVQLVEPAYGGRWWTRPRQGEAPEFPMSGIIAGRYEYVLYHTGVEELFDYVADPFNRVDLRCTPAGGQVLAALRLELERKERFAARAASSPGPARGVSSATARPGASCGTPAAGL